MGLPINVVSIGSALHDLIVRCRESLYALPSVADLQVGMRSATIAPGNECHFSAA
jgi:hypothetical protein